MEPNESLPETLAAQINALPPRKRAALLAFVTHMDLVDRLIDVSFCTRKEWEAALTDARAHGDDVLTILLLYQDLRGHVLEGEDQTESKLGAQRSGAKIS